VEGADRVTEAITLFALLELYKQGELAWEQAENFGQIYISRQSTVDSRQREARS
jgi:segregation and condensation protein A